MSYDLYRTASIYESSANTVNINPSLAEPGYYPLPERPLVIHGIPEKPLPSVLDELDSFVPREAAPPEATYETSEPEVHYVARINLGLKARVAAELLAEKAEQKQEIERTVIPSPARHIGSDGLKLLAAANSL